MSIKSRVDELNKYLTEGKIMEAMNKFYADDVLMSENNEEGTKGLQENIKREEEMLPNMDWHDLKLINVAVNEETQTSMCEWFFEYTLKLDNQKYAYNQVAVQKWENEKIKEERFIYSRTAKA